MTVTIRPARPGDGDALSRVWLSAAGYYTDLDPEHFRVPDAEGLAERWDNGFARQDDDSLNLVAELDSQVVGWLWARIEPPRPNASTQIVRELGWTRLEVVSLFVHRDHWRAGAGTALLEAAEAWGRSQGARVARLDTYVDSPVSVPFYEEHMGYQRRSIVFQKQLLHIIRRPMGSVRPLRQGPYPQLRLPPGVRQRRHGPVPSGQSVRKR